MITIIIPTYNSGDFLVRCLESIKQQRREFYELIIIDNCSSDQTLEITTQFQDIVNLLISEADYGNYDAINKGISLSTGDWIYVLGADDFLFDCDTLLKAHKFLEALADDVLIAYGKVNVIDNNENFLYESGGEWWKLRKLFKSKMSIPHQGVFHRSEAFTKFGKFDSKCHRHRNDNKSLGE